MRVWALWLLVGAPAAAWGSGVVARFDPASADVGPFPSNALAVADASQKTGIRVNLPLPDCSAEPNTCAEVALVNQLDGFELQPRIRVRFSGAVDPDTLRDGVYFIWLENLTDEEHGLQSFGHVTPINQVSYDPATNTAYARPDEFFDQHRRYALIVSNAVRDRAGDPVEPDPAFLACLNQVAPQGQCAELARAFAVLPPWVTPRPVVAASVFTTMSATTWLEKARAQIQEAGIGLAPSGSPASFDVSKLASLVVRSQVGANPPAFQETSLPLVLLTGVSKIAFGSFLSPTFLNEQQTIASTPTGEDIPLADHATQVQFHAMLPATPKPAAGYPVVIVGHGLGDSSYGAPMAAVASGAALGFASIAINAVGHGLGPESTVILRDSSGNQFEAPAGGRSIDLNGDGKFDPWEGCILFSGPQPAGARDCFRQTAVDLMQLVRAIRLGIDLDGDGTVDLDPNRIYYAGGSLGAMYGTVFMAVERDVQTGALNSGGGTVIDVARLTQAYRQFLITGLGQRTPPLLNRGNDFDDASVLRYRPVKIIDVPGAVAIQEVEERLEWLQTAGDPLAYATHLWSSTLPGVPMKRVLFQYGKGDRTVPNPTETALVRAANLRQTTSYYRHDLARAVAPQLPVDPHTFLVDLFSPAGLYIALAAQGQIMEFLSSGGDSVPDVNPLLRGFFGRDLFEVPGFLTEDLNFP